MSKSDLVAPDYLSPSSISTFQQCPLKFKYSRIDKMSEPPTEATLLGNFVHDVLEDLYKQQPVQRDLDVARQLARKHWDTKWCEEMAPWVPADKMNDVRWKAWWCIENLWNLETPSTILPSGIEFPLDVHVDGVRIKGFVDRWSRGADDKIIITDYKTGKTPNPRFTNDKYFQLLVYAVCLEQDSANAGMRDVVGSIELLFLKDSVRLFKDVAEEDRMKVKETLVSVRSEIDQRCEIGEFEPTPNKLCDWCSFKSICPYWNK